MSRSVAGSPHAASALALVERLQTKFVTGLEAVGRAGGDDRPLASVEWLRDEGRHGGGVRYVTGDSAVFDRASVNLSQVHYDDLPDKRLSSATALSCIIHPRPPRAPSVHMHISWTEMRDGHAYWRMMADLNPALPDDDDRSTFEASLRSAAGAHYEAASAQGDRYFYIPALERHRGVSHFYLEGFSSGARADDARLAETIGAATIDTYGSILERGIARDSSDEDRAAQLAYHTLYLFQVLTLDRGTTSGLLVHDQNDVGILGSLPSHVDGSLLGSWMERLPSPQDDLLRGICTIVGRGERVPVTTEAKQQLAQAVRDHYRAHPEALALQASGDVIPPTVDNHR